MSLWFGAFLAVAFLLWIISFALNDYVDMGGMEVAQKSSDYLSLSLPLSPSLSLFAYHTHTHTHIGWIRGTSKVIGGKKRIIQKATPYIKTGGKRRKKIKQN